ncbi:MAG: arginine--tRNA ligase [Bacteroidota bacterium]
MQRIEDLIRTLSKEAVKAAWDVSVEEDVLQVQKTRRDFEGDFTLVVFPLLRYSKSSPEQTGESLGGYLTEQTDLISEYNVVKGFLNLVVDQKYWKQLLDSDLSAVGYGKSPVDTDASKVMIEFSSPNTNKPLHLGHIRNILLGHSVSKILEASGLQVKKVNLVNDRGIHICKSMLAWKMKGKDETPESSGLKGDHLVGKYYVKYDQIYKEQVKSAIQEGVIQKEAEETAPVLRDAREMLRKWEADVPEVRALWQMMNTWVYDGFDQTYERLGITFHKTYYESDTYKLGKEIILKGLSEGILYQKEDGSVWANLEDEGLDHKLLLRSDGTSVYMTQDVGTAHQRYSEFRFDSHVYVVGNEQNYHFQVLAIILKKLGYDWADRLFHLSYGMVDLPEGKMKSREGRVVDADDLMDEMESTARQMSEELGKLGEFDKEERDRINRQVGMGALKYFILKVDARKNMTFDPRESVDFNGNTGPFIQYTYARIRSVLRKGEAISKASGRMAMNEKEVALTRMMYEYPDVIKEAARTYNPSLLANFLYDLAKEFNQFYHDHSILNAEQQDVVSLRLLLVEAVSRIIESGMDMLGIEVPERM